MDWRGQLLRFSRRSASSARFSHAAAISSRVCLSVAAIVRATRMQSAANCRYFRDSSNAASSVHLRQQRPDWNFVLQQLCEGNLYGNYRDADFTAASGRDMCRHFLPSTTVAMRRNASDLPSRPRIPSIKPASLIWLRRFRSCQQDRDKKIPVIREGDPLPLSAGCLFFAAAAIDYFHDSQSTEFLSTDLAGRNMSPSIIPESRRCRTRARECRTMAERLRVQTSRDQMLKAALDFERMAQDAEQREIAQGLTQLKAFSTSQYGLRSTARRSD